MTKVEIGFAVIVVVCLILLVYQNHKYKFQIRKTTEILEEILKGNENLKIHIGYNDPIAPLVFKINQLAASYQEIKIKTYRKEQSRKQMFSNLSHDVRTPLTSVLGYLDALCDLRVDEKDMDDYLQTAKIKAYELKEYIDELFTMTKIDAEEMQLNFESVDLFELLRSELIGWIPELQNKNITLEVQIPDEECFIIADQHALTRVFRNMLQNAVRYGGRGNFIGVHAWKYENDVCFQVWDKGPGLSKEEVSKVFDRLYKSDSSRRTKGHGLGLAIAKELVQKMKGKIYMKSIPNTKTFVQVSIPILLG
ncbi:sensor histidine kinase YycG [Clostridium homopropionicum DSM 5847]|uniref:histidine kinase n=1 Tax=Clostridium homopropionicum DSM 5847 TaxID=1121318 RepID=A0A0L6Z545_9CLOT|nr:HAMP domain-containing sensor histidine kinase [Clostridium homopropionicum]KOA18081.1 sensor histidine kinase YycG [Clostridium homopropionicum DSM 5847]SFG71368.1 His Kinase A (phospho-acceptor) domain-containing protein [Clostridium homopropionicum]